MMPINHHASDELLLAYAAGRLSPAPALVVASHLAMSEKSAGRLLDFERLGGALLDEQPMADVAPGLFDKMLTRLQEPLPQERVVEPPVHGGVLSEIRLPLPLAARRIGKWRMIAPGIRFAPVDMPDDPEFKVMLLRVGSGKALPQHGHTGSELTLVLKGQYRDEAGIYGPGDIEEEDDTSNHQPRVEAGGECICLTAIQGTLRPNSLIARMMLPLFGF